MRGARSNPCRAVGAGARGRGSPRGRLEQFYRETWRPVMPHGRSTTCSSGGPTGSRCAAGSKPSRSRPSIDEFGKLDRRRAEGEPLNQRLKEVLASTLRVGGRAGRALLAPLPQRLCAGLSAVGARRLVRARSAPLSQPSTRRRCVVALELVVIVSIVLLVRHGRKGGWHERWIDYRSVAESLRHGRFLAFVSEFGRVRHSLGTISHGRSGISARPCGKSACRTPRSTRAYQRPLLQATPRRRNQRADRLSPRQRPRDGEDRPFPAQRGKPLLPAHAVDAGRLSAGLCRLILSWAGLDISRSLDTLYSALSIAKSGMIVLRRGAACARRRAGGHSRRRAISMAPRNAPRACTAN